MTSIPTHAQTRAPLTDTRAAYLDLSVRWQLPPGLALVQRDGTTIQLGTEPRRRLLIRDAPIGCLELLRRINGDLPLRQLIDRAADRFSVPLDTWTTVLTELLADGYLIDAATLPSEATAGDSATTQPDRAAIAAASDPIRAAGAMGLRRDAVTVIVGAGRVATSVATVLATAGVGHVHVESFRPLRPSDVAPAGLGLADVTSATSAAIQRDPATAATLRAAGRTEPRSADRDAIVAMMRRVSTNVRVHPPSGYVPPSLVVLADDGSGDQSEADRLMRRRIPHLMVRASDLRGVVGPLVAPGRSSCLHCHDLHRRDLDPAWPRVLLTMQRSRAVPPAVLATGIAALAAQQILQFLDGRRLPDSVDGTLEIEFGEWRIRRRSWQPHPACGCGAAGGGGSGGGGDAVGLG